ncbi:MAG TPA: glycosyl transferase [Verrucomicrobiales bacterium]|nr:glycosyl transferase [Verrucomicrobiales bacterium]
MHVVLTPFGSAGDVLPFIWLGRQLKARGHRVTMVTACLFEKAARAAGLAFIPLGKPEDFERMIADPRVWRLGSGTKLVFEFAGHAAGAYLAEIERLAQAGDRPGLLLAPCTAFGARAAREALGIPLVTVHLQPAVFLSAHEPPVILPGMEHLRRLPLWMRRLLLRAPNPADLFAGPLVRALCARRGVPPPRSLWWDWGNSPDGVLALFPEWFAAPQPDWPENVFQWDFPLEDLSLEHELGAELREFLAAGEKPVVFTPGSANIQARRFFEAALEAVTRAGCRAVFVTRTLAQVPARLPPSVLAVEYAPFSTLLRHAAAFVHHGGIGTLSQGFAAGLPQVVMPMAHDQPDNAHRLTRLGAGLSLPPRRFTPARVAAALDECLRNQRLIESARQCAARLHPRADSRPMLEWLENRASPQEGRP